MNAVCKRCHKEPQTPVRMKGDPAYPNLIHGYCLNCVSEIVLSWELLQATRRRERQVIRRLVRFLRGVLRMSFLSRLIAYEMAVDRINLKLDQAISKMEKLRMEAQEFRNTLNEIDTETTRIGTKWEEIVEKLEAGGMSDTEEKALFEQAKGLAARLKTIAADPENPVPTE